MDRSHQYSHHNPHHHRQMERQHSQQSSAGYSQHIRQTHHSREHLQQQFTPPTHHSQQQQYHHSQTTQYQSQSQPSHHHRKSSSLDSAEYSDDVNIEVVHLPPEKEAHERERMSDARLVAVVAIAIAAIATLIAFVSPNWLASERRFYGAKFVKLGLWETCFRSFVSPYDTEMVKYYAGCRWIFADEYQNIRPYLMPAFFIFTQIFYTLGFVFLLVASIGVLAIQLCFIIEKEKLAMRVLALLMFTSAFTSTIAVIVFGIWGDDRDWMPGHEHNFLSWSFGLAVVGTFFSWMAAVLFWAESRILHKKQLKSEQFNMEATGGKH